MPYFLILVITEGKTRTELENFIKHYDHRNHCNCISDLKILVPLIEVLGQCEWKEHCVNCQNEAIEQFQGNHALPFKRLIPQLLSSVEIRTLKVN